MGDFAATLQTLEETDAVRLSWNFWPNSKLEATKCVIPFGVLYTPNKNLQNMPVMPYEPIPCKTCGAVLNPYAMVDYNTKVWTCPFCHNRNYFPSNYQAITEQTLPAELFPNYGTIEYTLNRPVPLHPPVYLLVVDTCVAEDELQACKTALLQALTMIPDYAMVGLITYGTHVHVHELGFTECMKSFVFRGSKEYTTEQVIGQLGITHAAARAGQATGPIATVRKFLQRLSECEFQIQQVIEELQRDAYPVGQTQRPARCTGTALTVATALLKGSLPPNNCAARIMLFAGGPGTEGSGKIITRDLAEEIRSHKDLAKDSAPHFRKAKKFYDALATELVAQGFTLDVFACALDQIGLSEMKELMRQTGGLVVQTDTYTNPVFKESLKRVFAKPDDEGFLGASSNATFEVIPSRDIKVAGILGSAARMERKDKAHVAETEVGLGGTTLWKLCSLDFDTTVAVFLEITSNNKEGQEVQANEPFFLQFVTRYLHWSGQLRCRVTTIRRYWVAGSNVADLTKSFDQEACAVLMTRLACHKLETEEDFDPTRWLDRCLIRLASRFGEYRKDDPDSFYLPPEMAFYPQFMFNLRRSQFVQVFGASPDEAAYFRLILMKVPTSDGMVMIQPQLSAYSFVAPEPQPVMLDVDEIKPDRILLLDAFFQIVVFHGTTIAQWRKQGFHQQEEHAAFKALLEAPAAEAREVARRRFPVPRIVDCDQYGSQARFLLVKLNPSNTYNTAQPTSAEVIMTDDVSLSVFTEHLKRLAVAS